MCVPIDAELPDLGLQGPLPSGQRTTLTTLDGSPFAAYEVRAPVSTGTGIVVLPDVRGLFAFYERLSDALASVGFDTVAIDYFGRSSGVETRDPDSDPWPALDRLTYEQLRDDVGVAVGHLRATSSARKVIVIGFCYGGLISLREAYAGHGVDGVVVAYGAPTEWENFPSAFDRIRDFTCPVLGLFGEADHAVPVEDVREFDAAMSAAGMPHDITIYDGAPHSFFDRHHVEFADASRDAWNRIVSFARAC